jgi:hypothetical protein
MTMRKSILSGSEDDVVCRALLTVVATPRVARLSWPVAAQRMGAEESEHEADRAQQQPLVDDQAPRKMSRVCALIALRMPIPVCVSPQKLDELEYLLNRQRQRVRILRRLGGDGGASESAGLQRKIHRRLGRPGHSDARVRHDPDHLVRELLTGQTDAQMLAERLLIRKKSGSRTKY